MGWGSSAPLGPPLEALPVLSFAALAGHSYRDAWFPARCGAHRPCSGARHGTPRPGSLEDHVVGVVGVAHSVGPPQQHLERDVGDKLPELLQPPPGALV